MKKSVLLAMGLLVVSASVSHAGGLGIPLDGFLSQFVTWVIGLGFVIGIVGLAGLVSAQLNNPFGHLLSGAIPFFTNAGLLGGGTIILGAMGLVAGGLL